MARNKPNDESYSSEQPLINRAIEILYGKWRLPIILLLGQKTLRYTELKDQLPSVSDRVLAKDLRALTTLGVVQRKVYAEVPPRVEYTLTERGRLALPIFIQLKEIGRIFSTSSDDHFN
ncbi:helix-turn-helix transcriptional regulator [Spirosoma taeanense]|uniref:Helix-turn-helix transcriptional regulator n=1 Tax=Spirosoma taeanense TaxID=2735870 RepID=A0A6M5YFA8_9BACT|nr:helix-turn-helix domain-containing protein [Spirosoma taeanense]QJW91702.1 helix-turn-helix transcriptional regulator [Spirosoma taeanense]